MSEKFVVRNALNKEIHTSSTKSKMIGTLLSPNQSAGQDSRIAFKQIPVEDITPRFVNRYSQKRIDDLAKSIKNTDCRLIHPIVLVNIKELPANSEILKAAKENGKNISDFKYIIVSGERRFHAWLQLREEEKERIKDFQGAVNRFDTITANILTPTEAMHEETYYKDANDLARHISPEDTVWYIKDILKELDTEEAKYNALIEMGYDGNIDWAMKPTKYPTHKYIAYRLKKDKGIDDWAERTIKLQLGIAQKGDDKLADALLQNKIAIREAQKIISLPKETQVELLAILEENPELYRDRMERAKKKCEEDRGKAKKAKLPTHADARRILRADLKRIKEGRNQIEEIIRGLGDTNSENERYVMEKYDEFIVALEQTINKAK